MPPIKTPLSPANTTQVIRDQNPTDRQSFWQKAVDQLLKSPTWDWPVLKQNGNPVLDVSNEGSLAGQVITWAPGPKYPAGDGSLITNLNLPSITGRLVAGTAVVMNPIAANGNAIAAHALGATPNTVLWDLECIIAEHGYSVGDRAFITFNNPPIIYANATNVGITVQANLPALVDIGTHGSFILTAANWKVVAIPYRLT